MSGQNISLERIFTLDALLLFIFAFTDIWIIRHMAPIELSVVLSNIVFVLFVVYIVLQIFLPSESLRNIFRVAISAVIIITIVGGYIGFNIFYRHLAGHNLYVWDAVLQPEEAMKYVLSGKNPFREDYFETPLGEWMNGKMYVMARESQQAVPIDLPSIHHLIYLPFYWLSSIPLYIMSQNIFGWYDQRFQHIIAWLLSLLFMFHIPKRHIDKLCALIFFGLNPILLYSFSRGSNDIFIFFWLALTAILLKKQKYLWSSVSLGLACSSKHTAWFLVPFYLYYIYLCTAPYSGVLYKRLLLLLQKTFPLFLLTALFILPFAVWDFQAFWSDVYLYPAGKIQTGHPIYEVGFSVLLGYLGIIQSPLDYFPFWIAQLFLGLPLLLFLLFWQKKDNTLAYVFAGFGCFLFVFLFLSRFFYIHYFGNIAMIFILAYFLQDRPRTLVKG